MELCRMSALILQLNSAPAVMKALDRFESEIRAAPTLDVLLAMTEVVAALHRRWKPVKDVSDRAGECWNEAEEKLAEERAKLGKATGTRGQLKGKIVGTAKKGKGRGYTGEAVVVPPVSAPSLKELGLGKRQAARAEKIRELGRAARKKLEAELKAEGKPVNPHTVLALQRKKNKVEKKHAIAKAVFSATGPFDCVIIDPPWNMQKIDREERPNQDAFDYPVMTEAELISFWAKEIANELSPDCHVFVWTTQKFLPAAIRLLEPWGLNYVLTMVWHKSGGFQPIDLPQYNCEFIVYARKGAPVFIDTKAFDCCFEAPRREHSRKPDYFYDLVRRVTGGSRVDVFSRELREGFAQLGNQPDKFAAKTEAAE
jgi:N6-adenosine-specific RNA methylase IME4